MIQDTIDNAIKLIFSYHLGKALQILRPLFEEHRKLRDTGEMEDIELTFRTMLSYMRQNADDPDRQQLYVSLLKRTYCVAADLDIAWRCRNVGFYVTQFQKAAHLNMSRDFIRTVLETFVSDVAMLSLDTTDEHDNRERELYLRHQTFMERLFASIVVSCQWKDGDRKFWEQLLVSPTIDSSDALVIVSAITLSAMNQFDMNKLRVLAGVYLSATDTALKERALIGFVFSVDVDASFVYAEEVSLVEQVTSAANAARELLELQKQIVYCINAGRDTQKINEEIMPDLTRNAPFRVNINGMIEEKDYDRMQEILHPDADDKAMDAIEQSVQKIADMQRQGADIYFGGFSQMKRFPFFSEASNWFVPFRLEHPALADVRRKLGKSSFLQVMLTRSSFCESDKYSFVLAVSTIIDRMPPNMREMMTSAEAAGIEIPREEATQPTFIRRMYLQDLYRFFNLHPQRADVVNPFAMAKDNKNVMGDRSFFFMNGLFSENEIDRYRPDLAVFLHDQKRYDDLLLLLQIFSEKQRRTLTYLLLRGRCMLRNAQYAEAVEYFDKALQKDSNNEMALRSLARSAMLSNKFDIADKAYANLLQLHSGNKAFLVGRSIALFNQEKDKEASELVYEADYRYPNDAEVRRIKAWMYLYQLKPAEALKEYEVLTSDSPLPDDYLNMGYALWASGNLGGAGKAFSKFVKLKPGQDIFNEFNSDQRLLAKYNISEDDMYLMEELVDNENEEDGE